MHPHDYIMGSRPELSDRLIEAGHGGSFGGEGAWGVDARRIEDLAFDHVSRSLADYRTTDGDPRADAYSFWPSYQPYQPEIPPPARYERSAPPPPAFAPEPEPKPVKYEDCLMTQALFDWNMRHLPETPAMPFDD